VAGVLALNDHQFARITTPVRNNINSTTTDDPRPTLEVIDHLGREPDIGRAAGRESDSDGIRDPAHQCLSPANGRRFGGTVYAITLSGLTVTPVTAASDDTRPQIAGLAGRGQFERRTTNVRPGGFITVNGQESGGCRCRRQRAGSDGAGRVVRYLHDFRSAPATDVERADPGADSGQCADPDECGSGGGRWRRRRRAIRLMVTVQRPPAAGISGQSPGTN